MMLDGLFNCLNFLVPAAVFWFLLCRIFGYRFKSERHKHAGIVLFTLIAALQAVCAFIVKDDEISSLVSEISLMAVAMFFSVLFLNVKKKISLLLFGLLFCTTLDYICMPLQTALQSYWIYADKLIPVVICTVLFAVEILMYININVHNEDLFPLEVISPLPYVVMIISELSMYYDIIFSDEIPLYKEVSTWLKIVSGMILVAGLIYFSVNIIRMIDHQRETDRILRTELRHYEEVAQKNETLRKFRHDYQNNLFSLNYLLNAEQFDDAKQYINELSTGLADSKLEYVTGNPLADAILSEKSANASVFDIKIDFNGKIPRIGIDNLDLCTVLSNAIDNAVRGCAECAPCVIDVNAYVNQNSFVLCIKNPVKSDIKIVDNSIKTTKNDSENHGIGLKNIKSVAKKYSGNVELLCENKVFSLNVGFILKEHMEG